MALSAIAVAAPVDYGFGNLVRAPARTAGEAASRARDDESDTQRTGKNAEKTTEERTANSANAADKRVAADTLTPEQQRQVRALAAADREVRAHEQMHISVGGDLVRGGPSFTYTVGPDKKRYAVSGEVSIDTTPGRTPEETIPKAQHIRATALAPPDPSPQDRSVAAKAAQMEGEARRELAELRRNSANGETRDGAAAYTAVAQAEDSPGGRLNVFA